MLLTAKSFTPGIVGSFEITLFVLLAYFLLNRVVLDEALGAEQDSAMLAHCRGEFAAALVAGFHCDQV